eukprot:326766-Pyramimonas_sp.AAC.2
MPAVPRQGGHRAAESRLGVVTRVERRAKGQEKISRAKCSRKQGPARAARIAGSRRTRVVIRGDGCALAEFGPVPRRRRDTLMLMHFARGMSRRPCRLSRKKGQRASRWLSLCAHLRMSSPAG